MNTTLPQHPAAHHPKSHGTLEATALRRRILIVDDDPSVLGLVTEILEGLDVDVETCADPEAALRLFEESAFDVVISDDRMPKMTGRDMLARLRGRHPETPTILMTGYGTPDKVEEAYERSGVFGFVHKPWNNRELVETVADALRVRRLLG